ncbi:pre-rRNA-processing protein TSR2 homolog [Brevipalpus obovatus]|uniref:pre-rRNA-processing protein TSR2 homolog n=1 Tax=Brevipalpus obovatus TaxID=246614 RepID=UPI003D9F7667
MARINSSLFLSAVNQSFQEWTELKHVIDVYGAGGSQAGEKLLWMGDVVVDYFRENQLSVVKEEIDQYISQMLDNEFDFIPMDSSLEVFIRKLLEYYDLCYQGLDDQVKVLMEQRKKANIAKHNILQKEIETLDNELTKVALTPEEPSTSMDTQSTVDPDGWTVVSNKKKSR